MESEQFDADYRVEVSGWDAAEKFFVERATLALSAGGERLVYLRHPLRTGLMLFLRMLDTRVGYPTFPVAYQVKDIGAARQDGTSGVTLERLQHRRETSEENADSCEPAAAP